jgi:hypothetical protein
MTDRRISCESCLFYSSFDHTFGRPDGECRRFPPLPAPRIAKWLFDYAGHDWRHPPMGPKDWCGEWQAADGSGGKLRR